MNTDGDRQDPPPITRCPHGKQFCLTCHGPPASNNREEQEDS